MKVDTIMIRNDSNKNSKGKEITKKEPERRES